jgi:hypothetical protein
VRCPFHRNADLVQPTDGALNRDLEVTQMSQKSARFTQADITRAIKGGEAGGLRVRGAEIWVEGTIRILADESPSATCQALDSRKVVRERLAEDRDSGFETRSRSGRI